MARGEGEKDKRQSMGAGGWWLTSPHLTSPHLCACLRALQVDIEGSELELCEDLLAGGKWLDRVRCLSFELHDRLFKDLEPRDRITRTCAQAMVKSGMTHMGQFGELVTWCRLDPALKEELERTRARAKEQNAGGRAARLI